VTAIYQDCIALVDVFERKMDAHLGIPSTLYYSCWPRLSCEICLWWNLSVLLIDAVATGLNLIVVHWS